MIQSIDAVTVDVFIWKLWDHNAVLK